MAEKKLPTPQPTPPGVSVHETGPDPAEGTKVTPLTQGKPSPENAPQPEHALQAAQNLGIDASHAPYLEGVARAVGGGNWQKWLKVLTSVLKGLQDSGVLGDNPVTPERAPSKPK